MKPDHEAKIILLLLVAIPVVAFVISVMFTLVGRKVV